jgi:hypothetical protein
MLTSERPTPILHAFDSELVLAESRVIEVRKLATVQPPVKGVFLNPDTETIRGILCLGKELG